MDLEELKAFTEANELTVRPYKRLVWAMLATLLLFMLLFGGAFYYFMYKAFYMGANSYIEQSLENSNYSSNNAG